MKCPAYHCLKERVVLGVYVAEAGVASEECNITNSWRLHLLVHLLMVATQSSFTRKDVVIISAVA